MEGVTGWIWRSGLLRTREDKQQVVDRAIGSALEAGVNTDVVQEVAAQERDEHALYDTKPDEITVVILGRDVEGGWLRWGCCELKDEDGSEGLRPAEELLKITMGSGRHVSVDDWYWADQARELVASRVGEPLTLAQIESGEWYQVDW